jgi:hypothetical protein
MFFGDRHSNFKNFHFDFENPPLNFGNMHLDFENTNFDSENTNFDFEKTNFDFENSPSDFGNLDFENLPLGFENEQFDFTLPFFTSRKNVPDQYFRTKPVEEITKRAFTGVYEIDKEIVMKILDVETLVRFYNTSHYATAILNDRDVLENLVDYYILPQVDNFTDFLQAYDRKYVTHRCTNYYHQNRCYYKAIKQDNPEMIDYFKKFVEPNTLDIESLLYASAGGNYNILKETLEKVHGINSIKINYSRLLKRAIKNNKAENFRLIYQSAPSDYQWHNNIVRFGTPYVKDVNFYKEILAKFPDQEITPEIAGHWPIFEYILSLMPERPDYADLILSIMINRRGSYLLNMIEKRYGHLFTPQEIYEIIKESSFRETEFSELMFDKYRHKLPIEAINKLTTEIVRNVSFRNTNFLFKILKVNSDQDYNEILNDLLTFGHIDKFYQVLKLVPRNYKLDYQKLATSSVRNIDFNLLKNIFDMAPADYPWYIEPIVKNLIINRRRKSEELHNLSLIMELLTNIDPNLDYRHLLNLAKGKKDTEIAEIFVEYFNRRSRHPSETY